jgi:transcriptional regulator GlxA family with amidase domain
VPAQTTGPPAAGTATTAGTGPLANSSPSAPSSGSQAAPAPRALAGRRRPETVAVLLFGGGPIFESSIPLSVFGIDRQDAGVPRYRLLVCGGEEGPLATTGGLSMTTPYGLEALSRAGTVVVPAWRSPGQNPPSEALEALRRAHREGARIIGLCTGAFVLAAAGLLDGRPATTHWMYAPTLAKRFPRVLVDPRELFIDDGDVLTSAGTAAGIDLCLHVVRTDHGTEAANALARRLVVPARRSGGQAQYIDRSLPEEIGSDPLAEVVTWALDNLNQQFDVEALAARAYMSRRTFDRRFRSLTGSAPLQWLISQRVLQAQRLLETTDLSVDEVARRCGFRSPVALRGHFRRQLGVSPAVYRTNFRSRHPAARTAAGTAGTVPPQGGSAGGGPAARAGRASRGSGTDHAPAEDGRGDGRAGQPPQAKPHPDGAAGPGAVQPAGPVQRGRGGG